MAQTHIGWMSKKDYYLQMWNKVIDPQQYTVVDPVLIHNLKNQPNHDKFDFEVCNLNYFRTNKALRIFDTEKKTVYPIGYLCGTEYDTNSTNVHWNVFIYNPQSKVLFQLDPDEDYLFHSKIGKILRKHTGVDGNHDDDSDHDDDDNEHDDDDNCDNDNHIIFGLNCQKNKLGRADSFCQTWIILVVDYIIQYELIDNLHIKEKLSVWKTFFDDPKNDKSKLLLSWLWRTYGVLEWGEGWGNWLEYTKEEKSDVFGNFKGEFIWFPPPEVNPGMMMTRSRSRKDQQQIKVGALKKTRSKTICTTCAEEWSAYKVPRRKKFLNTRFKEIKKHAGEFLSRSL
jgi:hypothetical protein